jgi:citrate synthase
VLGLPGAWSAGLFAIGRMAGWTAHILEQRQQEFLLRPRARYTGRTPVERPYF